MERKKTESPGMLGLGITGISVNSWLSKYRDKYKINIKINMIACVCRMGMYGCMCTYYLALSTKRTS